MKVTFAGEAEDQFRDIQAAFREVSQELASKFVLIRKSASQADEELVRGSSAPL